MYIEVHGLNHKTSPVEIRERLSICGEALEEALSEYNDYPGVDQCLLLSTCNRMEVYTVMRASPESIDEVLGVETAPALRFLSNYNSVEEGEIAPYLYHYAGREAVEHLYRVVCGLDSMVLGENQILGQFRDAYSIACEMGTNGTFLNKLAHSAIRIGKQVRTKTRLNEGSLSISYASCDLAAQVFGKLNDARALVVGAGETGHLTAENLKKRGVSTISVINRTYSKAKCVAHRLNCEPAHFDCLEQRLVHSDIVITCTASPEPIITRSMMRRVMATKGPEARMVLIDLAVPRDIQESVGDVPGVQLRNIDALEKAVEENSRKRFFEAEEANKFVQAAVEDFLHWQKCLIAVPTIRELQVLFDRIRQEEIDRCCGDIPSEELERIERVTNMIVGRIAKLAITKMKAASTEPQGKDFIDHVKKLFDLTEV